MAEDEKLSDFGRGDNYVLISFTSNLINIETAARGWDIYDRCAIKVKTNGMKYSEYDSEVMI